MRTTNAKSSNYTTRKEPFQANNLSGQYVGKTYVVYSYGYYPIYVNLNGTWYKNMDKYSVTTSKQQTQSAPELYGQKEFKMLNTQMLDKMIELSA
tara:strand:+ start:626 stop:910 length:285 start_codon:yes stop_codon:yes gene_type:complete